MLCAPSKFTDDTGSIFVENKTADIEPALNRCACTGFDAVDVEIIFVLGTKPLLQLKRQLTLLCKLHVF